MFSALRFRSWMKPHGQFGWLEVLLILAGALIVLLLQAHPSP